MKYGPAVTHFPEKSSTLYGVEGSVAVNQFIASTLGSAGFGATSLMVSVLPFAESPEIVCALPSKNACAPTTDSPTMESPPARAAAASPIFGLSSRSNARTNHCAVTVLPLDAFWFGRILNVYVFPSFETATAEAASG